MRRPARRPGRPGRRSRAARGRRRPRRAGPRRRRRPPGRGGCAAAGRAPRRPPGRGRRPGRARRASGDRRPAADSTITTNRPSAARDSATTHTALLRPDRAGPTTRSRRPSVSGRHQQAAPSSPPIPSNAAVSQRSTLRSWGVPRADTWWRRTTDGRAVHRQAAPSVGRRPARCATAAMSAGVTEENCSSRLSCSRIARPGGGSRGTSVARSPASAASRGSMLPRRKVRPATSPHRGCSRLRPPETAPTTPTDRPSRSTRTSMPVSGSVPLAGWPSTSWSQPSTMTRMTGRAGARGSERSGGEAPRRRSTSSRR